MDQIYFQRKKRGKPMFKTGKYIPQLPHSFFFSFCFCELMKDEKNRLNLVGKCTWTSQSLLPWGTKHSHKHCLCQCLKWRSLMPVKYNFFSLKPRTAFQNASCPLWMHVQIFDRQGAQHVFSLNLANVYKQTMCLEWFSFITLVSGKSDTMAAFPFSAVWLPAVGVCKHSWKPSL